MFDRISDDDLFLLMSEVQKPGRYTGGEWNEIRKNPEQVDIKVALAFPDIYEIGMSHLGQRILYHVLNEQASVLAERVFAPWPDFESVLRKRNIPLYSLENRIPLSHFDIVGFSLLYELTYTNVLTMLDLGNIPLLSSQRGQGDPLVIAGGPTVFNPEPIADFFDLIVIGDGEESFLEIIDRFRQLREQGVDREDLAKQFIDISGVYVPSQYKTVQPEASGLLSVEPIGAAPKSIKKRILHPFHEAPFPEKMVVPNIGIVFDRAAVEVERGCPQKCRFCQATSLYFPPRIKDADEVIQKTRGLIESTGYEDTSLSALSISDYPYLEQTIEHLMNDFSERKVSLSLSALRPKGLTPELAENILKVRKTGFTLVPEAGTERLRRVINKDLKDGDIWSAVENAFSRGWRLLKLYFMVGLPTEEDKDLIGILDTIQQIVKIGQNVLKRPPNINLSISSFIPKPHTPFQWERMEGEEELQDKHGLLLSRLKRYRYIQFKKHAIKRSLLEAVFSRGDRRLADVLLTAWKRGARFDSWDDWFDFKVWEEAFKSRDLDYRLYFSALDPDIPLPWDHVDTGVKKEFLLSEREKAYNTETTPSCLDIQCAQCDGCSVRSLYQKKYPPIELSDSPKTQPADLNADSTQRYRIQFSKTGRARFLSHIDINNLIQRALRRAGISVLYSQGFHPKMQISHLPALPLGMEGLQEYFEFKSDIIYENKDFCPLLNRFLPEGIRFLEMVILPEGFPSLVKQIRSIVYSVDIDSPLFDFGAEGEFPEDLMAVFQENEEFGPNIESLQMNPTGSKILLSLKFDSNKPVRPQDVFSQIVRSEKLVYMMAREKVIFS
ncbi:TIGR03960 family B12-binding radical SAM protein [Acidobacteriota bacterium]